VFFAFFRGHNSGVIPCILHEDEHLLVVNKPPGVNTHAPSPFAGEGIYDWLRHREPRWASLAIIHRLDKETSGVMVFGKTPLANRSLTEQFTQREVRKRYLLLTDRPINRNEFTVKSDIRRAGEKYASGTGGEFAETHFKLIAQGSGTGKAALIEAEPQTGRTHQIRVHAAESGIPIVGDTLYGGSSAPRVCLHAAELRFKHPETGEACTFSAEANFSTDRRSPLINADETNACRLIHGASDGWPGWYVERLGDFLLSQSERSLTPAQQSELEALLRAHAGRGAYHKLLNRQVRKTATAEASPTLVVGETAPERFEIRENGVRYELGFNEGYSVGLFLDQRDNRRRFLIQHVAGDFPLTRPPGTLSPSDGERDGVRGQGPASKPELLNCFAYTCGFSVCAGLGGMRTTSLDLSKKYLEWGKRNFELNGLNPLAHEFIYGDSFDWLRRLGKKGRTFDAVVLDPPTFSQSKESGVFRAEKDYGRLVKAALGVLRPSGVLLASTNAADWPPEAFVNEVRAAVRASGRRVEQDHYVPQPMDFPITREEPGHLKTFWLRVE